MFHSRVSGQQMRWRRSPGIWIKAPTVDTTHDLLLQPYQRSGLRYRAASIDLRSLNGCIIRIFSKLQQSIFFLKGRQGTYLKRFLKRYWPNNARLNRRRGSRQLSGPDPALLRLYKCCTRMDHLPVFLEYNIHIP